MVASPTSGQIVQTENRDVLIVLKNSGYHVFTLIVGCVPIKMHSVKRLARYAITVVIATDYFKEVVHNFWFYLCKYTFKEVKFSLVPVFS
jgi:hypothetical protein